MIRPIEFTFPFNFLFVRGDRKSADSIDPGFMLTTGACAGFCMLKNDFMLDTSLSYELSANERPFEASRQAAIHLAYCSSYQISWFRVKLVHIQYLLLESLTLSHRIHTSLLVPMPSSEGTSNLILNLPWDKLTSGVTSQPRKLIATVGAPLLRKCSRDLNKNKCKSLYVNQYRL